MYFIHPDLIQYFCDHPFFSMIGLLIGFLFISFLSFVKRV